jgi:hypothetical protein
VVEFDLIATSNVPVEDHFVLSNYVYLIPRRHGLELIRKLRKHLDDLTMDSPEAKEVLGTIIFEILAQALTSSSSPDHYIGAVAGDRRPAARIQALDLSMSLFVPFFGI